jgi:hypothetical protein
MSNVSEEEKKNFENEVEILRNLVTFFVGLSVVVKSVTYEKCFLGPPKHHKNLRIL